MGTGRGGPFLRGGGPGSAPRRVAADQAALPGWTPGELVGGGAGVPALRPAQGRSRPLRHHRPASASLAVNLVSLFQPQGQFTRGHRPALCVAQLDRAGLQVRERRARVGGLPGPRRYRHPPALAAGLRGLQLLLVAGRARRTLGRAAPCSPRIEACASRPYRSGEKTSALGGCRRISPDRCRRQGGRSASPLLRRSGGLPSALVAAATAIPSLSRAADRLPV